MQGTRLGQWEARKGLHYIAWTQVNAPAWRRNTIASTISLWRQLSYLNLFGIIALAWVGWYWQTPLSPCTLWKFTLSADCHKVRTTFFLLLKLCLTINHLAHRNRLIKLTWSAKVSLLLELPGSRLHCLIGTQTWRGHDSSRVSGSSIDILSFFKLTLDWASSTFFVSDTGSWLKLLKF